MHIFSKFTISVTISTQKNYPSKYNQQKLPIQIHNIKKYLRKFNDIKSKITGNSLL